MIIIIIIVVPSNRVTIINQTAGGARFEFPNHGKSRVKRCRSSFAVEHG